ncbi:hypothetical protein [Micromonospora sp. 067-2]|uniref:hypothetical protein n=1 Tax=Micromonospora sp. 067-2 TaxID=2789270 RepID=UPI00397E687C
MRRIDFQTRTWLAQGWKVSFGLRNLTRVLTDRTISGPRDRRSDPGQRGGGGLLAVTSEAGVTPRNRTFVTPRLLAYQHEE